MRMMDRKFYHLVFDNHGLCPPRDRSIFLFIPLYRQPASQPLATTATQNYLHVESFHARRPSGDKCPEIDRMTDRLNRTYKFTTSMAIMFTGKCSRRHRGPDRQRETEEGELLRPKALVGHPSTDTQKYAGARENDGKPES